MTTPRVGALGVLSATGAMLFRDAAGDVTEVVPGLDGDVLTLVGGIPDWSGPIEVLDAFIALTANDAIFAPVNGITGIAGIVGRNNHPLLTFDDTAAAPANNENVTFESTMPIAWAVGNDLNVQIDWVAQTAIIGDVKWNAAFEAEATQDLDADGFAADQTVTDTTNGTSGVLTRTSIPFSQAQADALLAGGDFRLQVVRDANAVGDTMVGDAQILRVNIVEV